MKKLLFSLSFAAIFVMVTTGALASNGGIIKWSQPPDMEFGVNIQSTEVEPIIADDWECRDPRPVTDVHFWGSYIGWQDDIPEPDPPTPVVEGFMIRIYEDVPQGPQNLYSHPGACLYKERVMDFSKEYVASIKHPDETYEHKYYYSLDLPTPFEQREGTIYWISIAAIMPPTGYDYPWGWETSKDHWNDNACGSVSGQEPWYWYEITPGMLPEWYPHRTVDMAFELTVPFEPPPPLEPVKWQQRPDMVQGVNIVSNPLKEISVADDWLCLDGSPVSDLHFWGSYPGWEAQNPEPPTTRPPGVEAFRIQIYSDAPAVSPDQFSRPDKLLYEVWVKEPDFTETYEATIHQPWWEIYEHKYRYDLDLPRMFWQKRDRIYWLNISAIPRNPELPWGWESSMDRWNDFAVKGWYLDPNNAWWNLIPHPLTGKPIDMSFELTTCEGPIKWLQFPDMANGFNIGSLPMDPVVADDFLCTDGKEITEVHFWGSYIDNPYEPGEHWQQGNQGPPVNPLPPTPGLETFKLSFHEDIPAGVDPNMPWSHPGELIREFWVEFEKVEERYWDSVPHTDNQGVIWWEHKFYYIVHMERPFQQVEGKIYWLDIGAIPKEPGTVPTWYWGWETSKDHWNDNAVRGWENGWWWEDLGSQMIAFEDLVLGTFYYVGDIFPSSGVPITVRPFQWSNGQWTSGGNTLVDDSGNAGGWGKEMWVNNVNLDFNFGVPIPALSLLFGEYGGNVNIEINGDFRNDLNFSDFNGLTIGGVNVSVVDFGSGKGRLNLVGTINQFAIGGQELAIDNVEYSRAIDMAFLLITEDYISYCECDLNRDGNCDMQDWLLFGEDWGRTDCYSTGDCECDLNYDSNCDMQDWLLFGEDWGRTDCPCPLN